MDTLIGGGHVTRASALRNRGSRGYAPLPAFPRLELIAPDRHTENPFPRTTRDRVSNFRRPRSFDGARADRRNTDDEIAKRETLENTKSETSQTSFIDPDRLQRHSSNASSVFVTEVREPANRIGSIRAV